jgi:hypothetical protein
VRERSNVIAAHGVSPYVVGARLDTLASRGLVANIIASENCDATWQAADATGRYAGRLGLTFESGRLTDVVTTSGALVTPSGARVGMTLRDLQRIYGDRGKLITGVSGNQAFSVPVAGSKLGIVFFFEAADTHRVPKINAISAGGVERLEQSAYVGEGC